MALTVELLEYVE